MTDAHKEKYREFIRMVESAQQQKFEAVVIATAETLGDNYAELITNLELLAAAKLALIIVGSK